MFVWPVHVDATPARPGGKFSEKADGELRLEIATVNPPGTDGWRKEFEARMHAEIIAENEKAQADLKNMDAERKPGRSVPGG